MERGKYYIGASALYASGNWQPVFLSHLPSVHCLRSPLETELLVAGAVWPQGRHRRAKLPGTHYVCAIMTESVWVSYAGGDIKGLALPKRVFPCASPAEVRLCTYLNDRRVCHG